MRKQWMYSERMDGIGRIEVMEHDNKRNRD
jgi:hypothetical protein